MDAVAEYKKAWLEQIISEIGTDREPTARRIIELAEINGLFDPIKALHARMDWDAEVGRLYAAMGQHWGSRQWPTFTAS